MSLKTIRKEKNYQNDLVKIYLIKLGYNNSLNNLFY